MMSIRIRTYSPERSRSGVLVLVLVSQQSGDVGQLQLPRRQVDAGDHRRDEGDQPGVAARLHLEGVLEGKVQDGGHAADDAAVSRSDAEPDQLPVVVLVLILRQLAGV